MRIYHLTKEMRHQPEHLTLVQKVMGSNRGRGFFFFFAGKWLFRVSGFPTRERKKTRFFAGTSKISRFIFWTGKLGVRESG